MEPDISVIIPTYNCASFIHEGIDSVLSQLPAHGELIIVDDGSTDDTANVLAKYEKKSPQLRVVYAEHSGVSGARNIGLDNATGRYVTFMDCDDCLQPHFFEQALPLLQKEADLYIFCIERIMLDGNRELYGVKDGFYDSATSFADTYIRERNLMVYSNCNKFYRRSIIEAKKLRFELGLTFGEDRLFNYAYIPACSSLVTSSICQLQYLQRSLQSQSTKSVPHYWDIAFRLHKEKMRCFLSLAKDTTEEERKDFERCDLEREKQLAKEHFAAHPEDSDAENTR